MAMTMSIGVEFVLKDSFSAPATKIATAFTSLRQSVAGLPAMTGQFNGFSQAVEQGAGQVLRGKGGGGGGGGGGGLDGLSNVLGKLGVAFASLKGAAKVWDSFAEPLDFFSKFQAGVSEVTTLSDQASFTADRIGDTAIDLNAAYGGGTQAQIKAYYQAISAGAKDAAAASALLTSANRFAVAGVTDVKTAVDASTNVLNAYGIAYENAGEVADAFFVAIRSGKTTASELGATVGRLAPTAASVGISVDQMLASIAAVTTKGLKTEEAVSGLKAAIANIIKPTSDAAAEASRLGIKFDQTTLRAKGLPAFLNQITSSAKYNQTTMSKLFGSVEGLNAVLALTANNSEAFNAILASMKDKTGGVDKAFEKMEGTLAFQQKRLAGVTENAKIVIGEALEPMAAAAVRTASSIIQVFTDLPKPLRDGIVKAAFFAATLVSFGGAALGVASALGAAASGLSALGLSLGTVLAVAAPLLLVIGAIGLAVVALRHAVNENVGGFADFISDKIAKVKLAFDALSQLFSSGEIRGDTVTKLIDPANASVLDFVKGIYTAGNRLLNFFDGLKSGFQEVVGNSEGTFGRLMAAVDRLLNAFGVLWGALDPSAAKEAFDEAGQSGYSFGTKVAGVALAVVDAITTLIDIVTGMVQAWHEVKASVAPIGESFSAIGESISEITSDFDAFGDSADDNGQKAMSFGGYVMGIFRAVADAVSTAVGIVKNILSGLMNILGGAVEMWSGIIHGNWSQAWRGFARIVYGYVELVIGLIGSVVEVAASAVDEIGAIFGQDIGAGRGIKKFKEGLLKDIKGGLGLDKPVEMQVLAKNAPTVADNQLFATNAALVEKMTAPEEQLFATNAAANVPPTSPAQAQAGVQASGTEQVASGIEALRTEVSALGKRPVQVRSEVDLVLPDGQVLASTVADANASDSDLGYR